ncbi:MAG: ABC transporter permease [Solobacterium sp.]|nr:ABC transporter permease [Solobacterium sp.]
MSTGKKTRAYENRTRFFRAMFARKIVVVATVVVVLVILAAVFADFLAPYNPNEQDLYHILQGPGEGHLLGTDAFGRDVLSRLLFGARISLAVGLMAVVIACVIGTILGMYAAYFGGIADAVIMRTCEALRSVPAVILAMALVSVFGGGAKNVAIILGISTIPGYVLMMRAQVLSVSNRDFVTAARLQGAGSHRVLYRHILPNCLSPLIVMMTQQVGSTILAEAGLSFLGVGISIPTASWGTMVAEGKAIMLRNPYLSLIPGICVAVLVISLNTMGDGIRDALDPHLRGEI